MASSIRLIAATPDMRELLVGSLAEHGIPYHSEGKVVVVESSSDDGSPGRVVALLREVLSAPEREAVSVVAALDFPHEFPVTTRLEAWWSVFETSWFEKAVADDTFSVWFQPVVNTAAQRTIGYECLLRLTHGHRREGAEIMAAAAARRDLRGFDAYTRQLAIRAVSNQVGLASLCFLNFIPSAIYRPAYCMRETMKVLRESGLRPQQFVMEAVETNRNPDIGHLRRIAEYLREQGLGFALDDVAANAEALNLLCELRPDYIKLDKQSVQRAGQPRDAAGLRRLVEIAERLGVRVVAKNVERVSTMENLRAVGIECMQGYLFGSPAPDMAAMATDLARMAGAIQPPTVAGSAGDAVVVRCGANEFVTR